MLKRTLSDKHYDDNCAFTLYGLVFLFSIVTVAWTFTIIIKSGDIELNPGPYSDANSISSRSSSSDSSLMNISGLSNHLSMVHYNVQSIVNKVDILGAEVRDCDILAFSKT